MRRPCGLEHPYACCAVVRWMAPSRICACRGCETHTGACGWPTTNERRCDRCGRPGFANRFRRTPDHPVRRTWAWRRLAKRTVEDWVARHGWTCPGWHRAAAPGEARRARGRPSRAARPRWRAAAARARRPLLELQRPQGSESAAAVTSKIAARGQERDGGSPRSAISPSASRTDDPPSLREAENGARSS